MTLTLGREARVAGRTRWWRPTDGWLRVGWAAFASGLLLEAVAIVRADRAWLIARLPDDAYYYLEIARRGARGQGTSVDGIHTTNGFHPLWTAVLTLVAKFGAGGDGFVKVALLLGVGCVAGSVVLTQRVASRVVGEGPALVAALAALHPNETWFVSVDGMESGLLLLCLAFLLWSVARALRSPSKAGYAAVGLAAGLTALARLDFALVLPVVPLVLAVRERSLRRGAWVIGVAGATVLPWLVWSQVFIGHLLPVSGSIKTRLVSADLRYRFGGRASVSYLRFTAHLAGDYLRRLQTLSAVADRPVTGFVLSLLGLAGAVTAVRAWRNRRAPWKPATIALTAVTAMIACKAVMDLVTLPYWAEYWYSAPARVAFGMGVALGTCAVLGRLWHANGRLARVAALAAGSVLVVSLVPGSIADVRASAGTHTQVGSWQAANNLAAAFVKAHPHAGGSLYGSTDSGVLSYYADPIPVVNLDGLVNDYAYAHMLAAGVPALDRYRQEHISYLIERGIPGGSVPACALPLWQSPWSVGYGGGTDSPQVTWIPVGIFDLRPCG